MLPNCDTEYEGIQDRDDINYYFQKFNPASNHEQHKQARFQVNQLSRSNIPMIQNDPYSTQNVFPVKVPPQTVVQDSYDSAHRWHVITQDENNNTWKADDYGEMLARVHKRALAELEMEESERNSKQLGIEQPKQSLQPYNVANHGLSSAPVSTTQLASSSPSLNNLENNSTITQDSSEKENVQKITDQDHICIQFNVNPSEVAWGILNAHVPDESEFIQSSSEYFRLLGKLKPNPKDRKDVERNIDLKNLPGGHPEKVDILGVCTDIILDQKKLSYEEGHTKLIYDKVFGPVLTDKIKGVYKNCRGIWASQWVDDDGKRHTKYFNPRHFNSLEIARVCAYRYRIAVTTSLSNQAPLSSHIRKYARKKQKQERRISNSNNDIDRMELKSTSNTSYSELSKHVINTFSGHKLEPYLTSKDHNTDAVIVSPCITPIRGNSHHYVDNNENNNENNNKNTACLHPNALPRDSSPEVVTQRQNIDLSDPSLANNSALEWMQSFNDSMFDLNQPKTPPSNLGFGFDKLAYSSNNFELDDIIQSVDPYSAIEPFPCNDINIPNYQELKFDPFQEITQSL